MGIKRIEKIRNGEIRARAGVANICGKIRQWENNTSKTEMVRPCGEKDRRDIVNQNMELGGHQQIGRPKLRWSDVIRKYMNEKGVQRKEA